MEIYKKLMAIQSTLKAPKGQKNTFGNYNYRSCEDIVDAVKPILLDNKCILILNDEVGRNDLIISCLLHDVGKMGYFGQEMYLPNILASGKVSTAKPYESNKSIVIEHQDLSLMILSRFINLTQDSAIAIKFHNGLYTKDGYSISGKETKLQMILHFADMWASRVVE